MLEVTVHIDRGLGVQTSKCLAPGSTVGELKRLIAEDDPTGQLQPEELILGRSGGGALPDGEPITSELLDLDLLPAGSPEEAPAVEQDAPALDPQCEPDQQATAVEQAAPVLEAQYEPDQQAPAVEQAAPVLEAQYEPDQQAPAVEQAAPVLEPQYEPDQQAPVVEPSAPWSDPPQDPAQQAATEADPQEAAPQVATEPDEGPERKLFDMLDRGQKGKVSQRDVLIALRKHPPIRQLFGLTADSAGALEARLLAIQDAFEGGDGLGELAPVFNGFKTDEAAQGFTWDEFFAKCKKPLMRGRVVKAAALFHREHTTTAAFVATHTWAEVPEGAACPGGLEYKMDMETGKTLARLPPASAKAAAKTPSKAPAAAAPPASPFSEGGPLVYTSAASSLFVKRSEDPAAGKITKVKAPAKTQVYSTGRVWTGPSGGRWAELDASRGAESGWALIEGPGFGLQGPALVDPSGPLAAKAGGDV